MHLNPEPVKFRNQASLKDYLRSGGAFGLLDVTPGVLVRQVFDFEDLIDGHVYLPKVPGRCSQKLAHDARSEHCSVMCGYKLLVVK